MSFAAWRRVPEAGACDFCLMLATRGAVYRTAQTAGDGNDYHRHCRCDATLETDFDRREDVYIAPEDANRQIAFRNAKTNRTYRYDLRKFQLRNPPDVPAQAPVTTATRTTVAPDVLPDVRRLDMTPDEALAGANPLKGQHNCVNCTATYEMRRRGLAVTAQKSRGKLSDRMISDLFDLPEEQAQFASAYGRIIWEKAPLLTPDVRKSTGWRNSFDAVGAGDPDGARYFVQWEWHGGRSGHIIAAERRDGVTVFIDPQTGVEFTGMPKGRRIPSNIRWVRIDEWDFKGEGADSYVDVR